MKKILVLLLLGILVFSDLGTVAFSFDKIKFDESNLDCCFKARGEDDDPRLKIGDIRCGLGLTIEIKNVGNMNLSDITLTIDVIGGLIIKLPVSIYEIPLLSVGESTEVDVKIFGIGLGIIGDLPRITISAGAHHAHPAQIGIIFRILGPLVIKVGEFLNDPRSFDGYTIFTPEWYTNTYLINNDGEIVHSWSESHYLNGLGSLLLENGNMIRSALPRPNPRFLAGGILGRVEIFDWNGSLVWYFEYTNHMHCHHHGVEVLPNGNILLIAWEYKTAEEAVNAGRNPNFLPQGEIYPDHIIEVEPTGTSGGNIVWEWHVWDHLIQDYDPSKDNYGSIEDHPELIDINFGPGIADWNHINSVDYNEELDQIMLSVRHFSELWIIDHSTTTEEAAGHTGGIYGKGGDILYRWGNPQAYRAGGPDDQMLFEQHDPQWIEPSCPGEGNILIFNNGNGRPGGEYSSIEEIVPPIDENGYYFKAPGSAYGPEESLWRYTAENPFDFFSDHISGCQRLPNGNTLICDGANGFFFEVTLDKEIVWEYLNQIPSVFNNLVFKIHRYAPDYPGLQNLFS